MYEEIAPQATTLIPEWTYEDFAGEEPYRFLFSNRDNKFLLQRMIEAAKRRAKDVKFSGFIAMWNAFVKTNIQQGSSILGESDTLFPGQPVQLRCGPYTCDEHGVHRFSEMTGDIEVISHPIMPVKRVTNIETFEAKTEIAFQRGNDPWKTVTVSRKKLASAQRIVDLAELDVNVNSENARELVKFLGDIESRNYNELPRQKSVGHMGWLPDGQFMPYVSDITYDGESAELTKVYNELRPTGSKDEWFRIARAVRSGDSVPARIALAAGFAAPLIRKFNMLPFFVHIWGEKGCGKTVALMLAASIWGNPEVGGFVKSFNGTRVSFETHAAFCGNLPVCLDELQVVNDSRKNFDEIIYMLCEGASKSRGTRDGGMQVQRRWSTCMITTGEMPIIQSNSGGGAAVRTIEVNYKYQPLFGTDEKAREAASVLKMNYGWAGQRFIEAVQQPELMEILETTQKKYFADLSENVDAKQVLAASIVLAADRLAAAAVFGDELYLKPDDIREFLLSKTDSDVNLRCYNWLMGVIGTNPRRFDPEDQQNGEQWGVIDEPDNRVYIIRSVFDRLLRQEGYSPGAFLDWANKKGILKRDSAHGNVRLTTRKRFNGVLTACVAVKLELDNTMTQVEVDDMPF